MQVSDFGPFKLSAASHSSPQEGMCVMEMVSFLAGEKWSDMPECSSPVVSQFCQRINDKFDQTFRDRLQSYVPRLIGTFSPNHEQERAEYLAWAAIRVFTPIAFRAAGMAEWAARLENLNGTLVDAKKVFLEAKNAAAAAAADAYAAAYADAYAAAAADANAAADAAAAAYAAAAAAYAAYAANARSDALLTCADLVRKSIPVSVIQKAMT